MQELDSNYNRFHQAEQLIDDSIEAVKAYYEQNAFEFGKQSHDEAAPRLKKRLYQERLNKSLRPVVNKLKSEADIERLPLD